MNEMFAQGDLLIERVADIEPSGILVERDAAGACVLAEGEPPGTAMQFSTRLQCSATMRLHVKFPPAFMWVT